MEKLLLSQRRSVLTQMARKTRLFPGQFVEQTDGNLQKMEGLLDEDYGLVGYIPHFSRRDMPSVLGTFFNVSPVIRDKKILAPIAQHEYNFSVKTLARLAGIELAPVVTAVTLQKELEKGTNRFKPGDGVKAYVRRSGEVLADNGIVFLAPQAGIKPRLEPFEGKPISLLATHLRSKKIDKSAFFFLGLEIDGLDDYSMDSSGPFGFHLTRKCIVTLGDILTLEEMNLWTKNQGTTPEEFGYKLMLSMAPVAYRGD